MVLSVRIQRPGLPVGECGAAKCRRRAIAPIFGVGMRRLRDVMLAHSLRGVPADSALRQLSISAAVAVVVGV